MDENRPMSTTTRRIIFKSTAEKLDLQAAEAFTWCRMENFQRTCNEHHGFLDGIPRIKNYPTQGLSLSHPFSSFREVLVLVIPTSCSLRSLFFVAFSGVPALPITRQPRCRKVWHATKPVAPAAPETLVSENDIWTSCIFLSFLGATNRESWFLLKLDHICHYNSWISTLSVQFWKLPFWVGSVHAFSSSRSVILNPSLILIRTHLKSCDFPKRLTWKMSFSDGSTFLGWGKRIIRDESSWRSFIIGSKA